MSDSAPSERPDDQRPGHSLPDDLAPTAITRDGDAAIRIEWNDGTAVAWTAAELRRRCPCATCRERRRADASDQAAEKPAGLPVLAPAEARPLRIESMRPVGNYAYQLAFSDGHDTGIFPFGSLHGSAKS